MLDICDELSNPDRLPLSRILVVEDTSSNQNIIEAFLMDFLVHLDFASNGREALNQFKETTYDLILMDIQMQIMDGLTATGEIRQWEKIHHRPPTPIIALTAHALDSDKDKSLAVGCTDHLSKPIRKKEFLDVMRKYLGPIIRDESDDTLFPRSKTETIAPLFAETDTIKVRVDPILKPYIPDFLETLKTDETLSQEYLEEEDYEKIRAIAHKMKGNGGTFGFFDIETIGDQLGEAALRLDLAQIGFLLRQLSHYLERVELVD
ncbi:MAG: response regulator [Candidatus Omnitrophota bacterium]